MGCCRRYLFANDSGVHTGLCSHNRGGISGNNAVGQKVVVKGSISKDAPGVVVWSGSDWQAELAEGQQEEIAIGATAHVVRVEGIRLIVSSKRNEKCLQDT